MATYIIPCSGSKAQDQAPARSFYTGTMFAYALAAVEQMLEEGDVVLVLSAKHGLVGVDEIVTPYDVKMGDHGSVTPEVVAQQALDRGLDWDSDVYALLPRAYFEVLDQGLRSFDCYAHDVYEATIGIGEHRRVCRLSAAHCA